MALVRLAFISRPELLSVLSRFITHCRRSLPSVAVAAGAVLWAGQTASRLFCRRSPLLGDQQAVVLYPCLLMYGSFALLSLY